MYRTTRSRTLPIPSTPTQQHHDLVFIKTTQRNIRYYILYDARLLHHLMSSIAKMYPDLVTLTTSQELYGLPGAGGEEGCPFYHEGGNNRGRDRRSLEERDDWDVVGGEEEGGFRRRVLRKVNRTKGGENETMSGSAAPAAPTTNTNDDDKNGGSNDDNGDYGDDESTSSPRSRKGCHNYILTIEDKLANPYPNSKHSAGTNGNERVGPSTVIKTALLLLSAADCETFPTGSHPDPPIHRPCPRIGRCK
mmetsp:Transcript_60967/g.72349  ORF Transcript_60967/g.72349 Transcript_60967/m.72349 type:complete len:249 (-) Transcript_60967:300-1046(-)